MMDVTSAFWHFSQQALRKLFLVTLIPFFLVAFEAQAETPFYGAVSGSFATTPSGAATYTIPIDVPPGIAGLQPGLSLAYNSQGGNGLLGVGWSLGGLSAITRCPKTYAQDGVKEGVKLDATDQYCLNGQRLVPYGTSGAEYRTEVDSFAKITSYGAAIDGPDHFVVETKSGQTIEFGNTADSNVNVTIQSNGQLRTLLWAANKISDTVGNALTVSYVEDASIGHYRISQINYSNNNASIHFDYEARNETIVGYIAGAKYSTPVRMTNIKTYSGIALVKDYSIDYVNRGGVKPSQIAGINECGSDGNCKSSANFTWKNGGDGTINHWNSHSTGRGATNEYTHYFADVNGDGMSDWIQVHQGSNNGWVGLSNGDGTFEHWTSHSTGRGGTNEYTHYFADVNGDGMSDWIQVHQGSNNGWVGLSNGDGTFQHWTSHSTGRGATNEYTHYFADVNGDGMADWIQVHRGSNNGWVGLANGDKHSNITEITDGIGNKTTINYKPITDNTIYTKDTTPPQFPDVRNVQAPIYVVASYETDNGVGGNYKISYTYGGAKSHRLGRGYLGFQWQETLDEGTGIATRTEYLQDPANYELIGRVDNSEVRLADNTLIRRADYTYGTLFSDAGMRFSYLAQSVESQYEIDGSLVSTVTNSTSGYDSYGNPRYTTINMTDGVETFTRQTDSIMTNDIVNWRLGVVTSSKLTNTIPGEPAQSRESSFTYDPVNGLLKSETIEPNNPALWVTTAYEYDLYGNKTRSTVTGADLVEPRITTTIYDPANNQFPYQITNAQGHTETRLYDEHFGQLKSLIGPNGLETTATYDVFGRTIGEYRADGTSTVTTYGSGSEVSCPSTVQYASNYVRSVATGTPPVVIYYDKLSREVQRCTIGFGGALVYKDTEYNARGERWRASRNYFEGATKVWTTYTYDDFGRVLSEIVGGVFGVTSYVYSGAITSITNPLSQTSSRTVNAIGELISVTDALSNSVSYRYDPFGNLKKVTDALGNENTMDYNIRGHKIWMDDPDMGYWDYGHNVLGELMWQRDAKLQTTTMQYDKLGRMIQRVDGDGTTTWAYDTALNGVGKLHTVTRPEDVYSKTYSYDQYGREQGVNTTILGTPYQMTTSYYPVGHPDVGKVSAITYPDGTGATPFAVHNLYDDYGYLEKVQKSDASITYWTANSMNADGQVTWEVLGNNVDTIRTFDNSTGLISAISAGNMGGVQSLSYNFDALGNLKQRIDDNQGYTENFLYDDLNRLTSAELVEFALTKTYQYNAIGNITHKSDISGGDYVYPTSGANAVRPHAVTTAGGNTYGYDANGNMVSGGGRTLAYTSYNKPYDIQTGSSYSTFKYAPDQGRIVQTSDQAGEENTTIYLKPVDNSNTLYEKMTKNNVVTHKYYIYGGSGRVAVHQERDNSTPKETRYFHMDHLGSIDAITDENGAVKERLSFDPFGKRRATPCNGIDSTCTLNSSITTLGFTGHEHLDGVGLIHMNGRVYDASLGRFMSADPHIQSQNPQNLNRYSYVNNNPLSSTDPSGFFFKKLKKLVKAYFKLVARVYVVATFTAVGFVTGGPVGAVAGFIGGMQAVVSYNRGMSFRNSLIMGTLTGMTAYAIMSGITDVSQTLSKGISSVTEALKAKYLAVQSEGIGSYLKKKGFEKLRSMGLDYLKTRTGLHEGWIEGYSRYKGGESWLSVLRGAGRAYAKERAIETAKQKMPPLFVDYALARRNHEGNKWFKTLVLSTVGSGIANRLNVRSEFRTAFTVGFSNYDEIEGVHVWDGEKFRGSLNDSAKGAAGDKASRWAQGRWEGMRERYGI